jgi:hypothetical protein
LDGKLGFNEKVEYLGECKISTNERDDWQPHHQEQEKSDSPEDGMRAIESNSKPHQLKRAASAPMSPASVTSSVSVASGVSSARSCWDDVGREVIMNEVVDAVIQKARLIAPSLRSGKEVGELTEVKGENRMFSVTVAAEEKADGTKEGVITTGMCGSQEYMKAENKVEADTTEGGPRKPDIKVHQENADRAKLGETASAVTENTKEDVEDFFEVQSVAGEILEGVSFDRSDVFSAKKCVKPVAAVGAVCKEEGDIFPQPLQAGGVALESEKGDVVCTSARELGAAVEKVCESLCVSCVLGLYVVPCVFNACVCWCRSV